MTSGYASGTLISGPQRGLLVWRVSAMQNNRKWLKNRGGHLLRCSFRAPNDLDTDTIQDTGHLLGGFTQPRRCSITPPPPLVYRPPKLQPDQGSDQKVRFDRGWSFDKSVILTKIWEKVAIRPGVGGGGVFRTECSIIWKLILSACVFATFWDLH